MQRGPETEKSTPTGSPPGCVETPRQTMCRQLKERIERGEYWVDLDFLACLLVDCRAVDSHSERPSD
jgi:hypothetical protein